MSTRSSTNLSLDQKVQGSTRSLKQLAAQFPSLPLTLLLIALQFLVMNQRFLLPFKWFLIRYSHRFSSFSFLFAKLILPRTQASSICLEEIKIDGKLLQRYIHTKARSSIKELEKGTKVNISFAPHCTQWAFFFLFPSPVPFPFLWLDSSWNLKYHFSFTLIQGLTSKVLKRK